MAFKAGSIYGEAVLNTQKWNSGLKGIIGGSKLAGAAIIAAFGVSVKVANDFQKEMSNVSTLIDETVISTQDLTKQLLRLDPALGNTTELTNGLYQSFSAGAETVDQAMQTTIDAAKFAKAALTETNTAVDVLTTAVNAYGRETVDTTKASDIFFTTIKQGKITGEQLAGSIGQSIPLFASAKIDLEELASGMAAMTKQGVSANEATTQLNAIVNSFLKPTEELSTLLDQVGYSSGSAFLEAEGLAGALKLLEENTKGDAAELAVLLPNIRAMRGAMALTGQGGKEFAKTMKEMEKSTGATNTAFDKQEKTFATLQNSLTKTQIVIGNIGKSFIDEIATGATKANESLVQFLLSSDAATIAADIFGFIAGAFSAVQVAAQPIIDAIGPAIERIFSALTSAGDKLAGKTAEGTGAFKLMAIASKGVSIGLTIVSKVVANAIDFIANLVDIVLKTGDVLGGFFDALSGKITWDEFGQRVEAAGDSFGNLVTDMVVNTKDLVESTIKEFQTFGEETDALAKKSSDAYTVSMNVTKQVVTNTWDELTTGQSNFIANTLENQKEIAKGIENNNRDASNAINQLQEKYGVSEFVATLLLDKSDVIDGLKNINDNTEEAVKTWYETWNEGTQKAFDSIQNFYDMASEITSYGVGLLNDLVTGGVENENAQLENLYGQREAKLKESLANGLLTQEQFDEQEKALAKQKTADKNVIAKKEFENQKAFSIASVIMGAADAIMGWWVAASKLGPVGGPIFGGIMTALTTGLSIARVAQISSQEFVPQYQDGGTASGLSRINEAGGEILKLPDGTTVIPSDISRNIAAASGNNVQNINFTINNPVLQDERMIDRLVMKVSQKLGRELRFT